ncbi:MAG: amidinotransferase [Deltaproteobacteria bacterium]|nr:amidinotransferase [Deltaproteobacteria bacterium]
MTRIARISDGGASLRRILMCEPAYYGIEYEINPWMSRARQADPARARKQWEDLYNLLENKLGLSVSLLAPVEGVPDLVFTANAGLVRGNTFIPSNFRHPERRAEAPVFRRWFEKEGYDIRPLPADLPFEGEGDAIEVGGEMFCGYRLRSDIRTHVHLGEFVGKRVLSLELVDPRFYHLDTCFCPLAEDAVACYRPALDPYALKVIETYVPRMVEISREDALRFACNAVVAGKKVVLNAGCGDFRRSLRKSGYEVWETDLSEFIKAGGAAKCLVLFLD